MITAGFSPPDPGTRWQAGGFNLKSARMSAACAPGGEEPTFGAVIKEFERRLRSLKMLVLLRTSDQDADTADLLTVLDAHLRHVEGDVQAVRSMMAEEQAAIEAAKELGHRAHTQAARVQAMQARLPAHLPGDARLMQQRAAGCERRALGESNAAGQGAASPRPLAGGRGAASPRPLAAGGPDDASASLKPPAARKSVVPSIAYLTTDELASAPAYMRTRLSLDKVNSAVDEVQDAFNRKYELLRAAGRALAPEQRRAQAAYKALELEHPKLKGLLFVSEDDLKAARHVKQDQTGKNIMSVLRHVQRLKELSAGGLRCWFMVG